MDIFKGLLFLEGHYADSAFVPEDFGAHYGNAAAAQRMFAERWAELDGPVAERAEPIEVGCG